MDRYGSLFKLMRITSEIDRNIASDLSVQILPLCWEIWRVMPLSTNGSYHSVDLCIEFEAIALARDIYYCISTLGSFPKRAVEDRVRTMQGLFSVEIEENGN